MNKRCPRVQLTGALLSSLGLLGCAAEPDEQPRHLETDMGIDLGGDLEEVTPASRPSWLGDNAQVGAHTTLLRPGTEPLLTQGPHLSGAALGEFSQGRELFVADWSAAGTGATLLDGLGPLFHASSCMGCHPAQGRPPGLEPSGQVPVGILVRLGVSQPDGWLPDPTYGGQLQPQAIAPHQPEATLTWTPTSQALDVSFAQVHSTSPKPQLVISSAQPLHAQTRWGLRYSPQLAGLGLLEQIPQERLLELEDPDDLDQDHISGRVAWLEAEQGRLIGRFGWKASQPSLLAQTAGALAGDMGLTSPLRSSDDCTDAQTDCKRAPSGGEPEVSQRSLELMVAFVQGLGVPAARHKLDDEVTLRGAQLFEQLQCASCHTPEQPTIDALGQTTTISPYTDLLLHDMGEGLCEELAEGAAQPCEWRTPPLWGIGIIAAQPRGAFLHDGRARSLSEAILWHGGEARQAKDRFVELDESERAALLRFLDGL